MVGRIVLLMPLLTTPQSETIDYLLRSFVTLIFLPSTPNQTTVTVALGVSLSGCVLSWTTRWAANRAVWPCRRFWDAVGDPTEVLLAFLPQKRRLSLRRNFAPRTRARKRSGTNPSIKSLNDVMERFRKEATDGLWKYNRNYHANDIHSIENEDFVSI